MRYWQGLESFVRQLVLSGNGTSNYISPCVLLHAGPPEPLTDDGQGGLQPRVTGQAGGVPPLKDLGAEMIWDIKSTSATLLKLVYQGAPSPSRH